MRYLLYIHYNIITSKYYSILSSIFLHPYMGNLDNFPTKIITLQLFLFDISKFNRKFANP